MPPKREISDVRNINVSAKAVKREKKNIKFTVRYIYICIRVHDLFNEFCYLQSSQECIPDEYDSMPVVTVRMFQFEQEIICLNAMWQMQCQGKDRLYRIYLNIRQNFFLIYHLKNGGSSYNCAQSSMNKANVLLLVTP
jgi:hypothetical protein